MIFLMRHRQTRDEYFNPFWVLLALFGYWLSPSRGHYREFLLRMDFAVVILTTLYMLVVKPLIYKGIIPAYYPREYSDKVLNFSIVYGLYAATSYGRLLPYIRNIDFFDIDNYTHPYTVLATVISLVLFFLLYYASWYVTIKRYDMGVRTIMFAPSDRYGDLSRSQDMASKIFLDNYESYKSKHGSILKRRRVRKMRESIPDIENDDILSDMFRMELEKTKQQQGAEEREREIRKAQEGANRRRNRQDL